MLGVLVRHEDVVNRRSGRRQGFDEHAHRLRSQTIERRDQRLLKVDVEGFLLVRFEQVGSQFGVGELKSVAVDGSEHHMFLFESKLHYLGVSAKGAGNVNALDAEIRRVLAQK